MTFEDHARRFIEQCLRATAASDIEDAYVVSLFVYDEEDDPRLPTATVGVNTESQVARATRRAADADEARWNFAFWTQDKSGVLGDVERDPEGAALREEWVRGLGLWYSDEEEDADFDAAIELGEQITSRFVRLLVELTQELHAEGTIERVFGRPIPVLIHELEYDDEIADQNARANPDGLADAFARWVRGL